jgi:capsular exopolysaccharide synthesis family protein
MSAKIEPTFSMPPDLDEHGGGGRPGIVESALRKAVPSREVVLRQGQEVSPGALLAPILNLNDPHGEEIRALRTALLLLSPSSTASIVLAVVSPARGEGRSQLAAELALSFAQLGKSTLLVDADLRRPTLHVLFGSAGEFGVSDAIAFDAPPYMHPVAGMTRMHFVAAGNVRQTNPLELLSDSRFARLLDQWRGSYSFVVIDTPPISEYADGLAVATLAGSVLTVNRAKHTSYDQVREMMRRLALTQSRVLGAVVSHF